MIKKLLLLISCILLTFTTNTLYAAPLEISDLTADATPGTDSLIATIDDPAGTAASRKSTIAQVLTDGNIPNDLTINSTSALTATSIDTGPGATEVHLMDQNVQQADAVVFATVNTGEGANELYDMDQNVGTGNDVTFNSVTLTTDLSVANGGTGASTLNDGEVLLGNATTAITSLAVTGDGDIIVGDGAADPTTLSAFTSSTGALKHEYGGLEADTSGYGAGLFGTTGAATVDVDTSAEVAAAISDETGSTLMVFSDSPTFTTAITVPNDSISAAELNEGDTFTWTGTTHSFDGVTNFVIPEDAAPTANASGEIAMDTSFTDPQNQGQVITHDGTQALYVVSTTDTPGDDEVPKYDDATGYITWEADAGASGTSEWTDGGTNIYPTDAGDYGTSGLRITDEGDILLNGTASSAIVDAEYVEYSGTGGVRFQMLDGSASEVFTTNGSQTASFQQFQPLDYYKIYLTPGSAILDDGNPPAISIVEAVAAGVDARFRRARFEDAKDDMLFWTIAVPDDVDALSDWYADVYWYSDEDVAETVIWAIQLSSTTENDADNLEEQVFDAVSFASESADKVEAKALIKTTITIDVDEQDALAAGDLITVAFHRDGDGTNGTDSHTNDADMVNVVLRIPRDYN